jgi:hypothetical protein
VQDETVHLNTGQCGAIILGTYPIVSMCSILSLFYQVAQYLSYRINVYPIVA